MLYLLAQKMEVIVKEKNRSIIDTVCMIIQQADGWLLQARDNKDGIWNPGKISHWGGRFEPEDYMVASNAALRELREETGLDENHVELELFSVEYYASTSRDGTPIAYRCHCFLVRIIDDSSVYVHEGQGAVLVPFDVDYSDLRWNINQFTAELLFKLNNKKYEAQA
ncbi:NUDIX domain-containing protein [Candidatus Saccharibacteria bacterium]|nr:NUDIX domain-containing protein [Candidatus Saccharibacteria bacterium]MCA9313016.1 NUDIX domain-containing protein [Candidatus Saccharibacteria bacterium]